MTLERDIRKRCVARMRKLGCDVYSTSDRRASRNTPGLPDLYVVPPRGKPAFWWESKGDGGKPSPEQLAFREKNAKAGVEVIIGGEAQLNAHLLKLGLIA